LRAEEEVENALFAYSTERDRRRALLEATNRDEDAVKLSMELYVKGLGTFLDVLDAQRSLFQVQSELAVSEAAVSIDLIALYKALGGGWSDSPWLSTRACQKHLCIIFRSACGSGKISRPGHRTRKGFHHDEQGMGAEVAADGSGHCGRIVPRCIDRDRGG
jgi:hypothetical protein